MFSILVSYLINADANQKKKKKHPTQIRPRTDPDTYNLEDVRNEKEPILQQGSKQEMGEHKWTKWVNSRQWRTENNKQ